MSQSWMGDHTAIDVAVVGMYGRAEELCGHRGNRNVRLIISEAKVSWTRAAGDDAQRQPSSHMPYYYYMCSVELAPSWPR